MDAGGEDSRAEVLRAIGVGAIPPSIVPFDPGYEVPAVEGHLDQSGHLMAMLKMSMAGWLIADRATVVRKLDAARRHAIPVVTGGGPFEIACARGVLPAYLDLCAELGFAGVEAGEGFTELSVTPDEAVRLAHERGLGLQFEVGKKHDGSFSNETVTAHIEQGKEWMDAGAQRIVVEARESAADIGLFRADGSLDGWSAERFATAFGLANLVFEAPTKSSQFALLEHFGPDVMLGNVRLEEILRVEIYRRGLHSDSFDSLMLAPLPAPRVDHAGTRSTPNG